MIWAAVSSPFPRSHEHLALLYRNIASLWIELFSACHIPSFQAESSSHACASHVPLIAVLPLSPALSLTSFRRKFQVHFPEFRAGHTEECAALDTKFYSCSCVSLAAQFSDKFTAKIPQPIYPQAHVPAFHIEEIKHFLWNISEMSCHFHTPSFHFRHLTSFCLQGFCKVISWYCDWGIKRYFDIGQDV